MKWTLLAVVLGFLMDLCFGDPRWLYHPVRIIGHGITFLEKILRKIFPKTKTLYSVSLRCLVCDEEHEFDVPLIDFMRQSCIDFSCPDILIGLAYIGKKEAVMDAVKENDTYIEEIVAACGLEHTGKNGITMLKALDKIQELSDDGNLTCACGSAMIDVDVLEDELVLECCMCGATVSFTADEIRNGNFSDISEIEIQKSPESAKDKN